MPKSKSLYFQKQQQKAKLSEFAAVSGFELGYRSREDITSLNPKCMVVGSKNVLTSTNGTVGNRRGYTLDGPANKDNHPVTASYDWTTNQAFERHLRYTNHKLQYRAVSSAGVVSWNDLITLTGDVVNFAEFWDDNAAHNAEELSILLFVDGTSNIFAWGGGIGTISGTTANTITLTGGGTWADSGFLTGTGYTRELLINGNTYAYTGGATTGTLTGVTPSPVGEANGSVVVQKVVTVPNSSMTGIPAGFKNTLIASQSNQIYVSSRDSFSVFVSKFNNFRDFSYSSPRIIGEGAQLTFKGVPTAIVTQDSDVYFSVGKDYWYRTAFTLSADLTKESLSRFPLKTGPLQASQSQGLTCKIKNKVAFVSFEPIVNFLGIDQNILNVPQLVDHSAPIVNDMNAYDFTGGHAIFFRKNLFISAPRNSTVIVYNMTQDDSQDDTSPRYYWEAPQILPVGCFSIIEGELYGHSSTDGETFKLFDGWNDNGHSYEARATFAYDTHRSRNLRKSADELFIEGYISSNTTLHSSLRREYGGSLATLPDVLGTDEVIVGQIPDDASLGKSELGNNPLGSSTATFEGIPDIPKFRVYLTYPRTPNFEEQPSFWSDGIDQRWQIVTFSTDASVTTEKPTDIEI